MVGRRLPEQGELPQSDYPILVDAERTTAPTILRACFPLLSAQLIVLQPKDVNVESILHSPTTLANLRLKNRIVMAPMTRSRADDDGIMPASGATYYAQRASAGLIITEGINISQDAIGSPATPGLFTAKQVDAWKRVTAAVHDAGGRIVAQLWHTGRVGHSSLRGGKLPVAPSAIAITGQQHFTKTGLQDYEVPRALSTDEVKQTLRDYAAATRAAKEAGFDGVELHAAFGYLPNQFLVDGANKRTDEFGGGIEARSRFVLQALANIVEVWGQGLVGIKLSPSIPINGMVDSDPRALYTYLLGELNKLPLGYVHLMQPVTPLDAFPTWPRDVIAELGPLTKHPVIANAGYTGASAEQVLKGGDASLVSFGSAFIANPDLPERLRQGLPLATPDRSTFYSGGDKGYIDYPRHPQTAS